MFTVYVDDSGTSKGQSVAVAGVLIIPAKQIVALDRVWGSFKNKYGFADLHSSECAALNRKYYPDWDEAKVESVFARARQITKKFATKAFSFSAYKDEFDSLVPKEWRETGGENHYTWAFRNLMHSLVRWHRHHRISVPFEFVFDNARGRDRREIDILMAQFEDVCPGQFADHYQFKKRQDLPALQCADLLSWSCYAKSRQRFKEKVPTLAMESYQDFSTYQNGRWLTALAFDPKGLREAIAHDMANPEGAEFRRKWLKEYSQNKKKKQRQSAV